MLEPMQVQKVLEEVSGAVMMIDPADPYILPDLAVKLAQLVSALEEKQPASARLAAVLAGTVEAMSAGTIAVDEASMEAVARGMASLQGAYVDFQRTQRDSPVAAPVMDELSALRRKTEGSDSSPQDDGVIVGTPDAVVFGKPTVTAGDERVTQVLMRLNQIHDRAANLNPDDYSQVAQLQMDLDNITPLLDTSSSRGRGLVEQLGRILERIILEECADAVQGMQIVVQGLALLEDLLTETGAGVTGGGDAETLLRRIAVEAGDPPETATAPVAETAPSPETAADPAGKHIPGEVPDSGERGNPVAAADLGAECSPEAALALSIGGDGPDTDDLLNVDGVFPASTGGAPPGPAQAVIVDADIFSDFCSEANEHLGLAESTMLELESNPSDTELLNRIFRSFHTIKGAAGFLNLTDITAVAHSIEDILDGCRKQAITLTAALTDVVLESIDLLKDLLEDAQRQVATGAVASRDVSGFLARVRDAAEGRTMDSTEPETEQKETPGYARDGQSSSDSGAGPRATRHQSHVRVDTGKLDTLVNVVGELVITQTQVAQNPEVSASSSQKLGKDISQLMKISNDLQEISMSLRMVPIRATFERMARMVRDLARKCGKEIVFAMHGEDTELDKNVVEEIMDPLTHMVRNAVDHGIESAAERRAAGKPEQGKILLQAYHRGGHIVIELRDNGKGIDRDRVLQKAVDRGLVEPDQELTDREVHDLIFHPGLSTADKVSDISGRGVGMDVVRRNIEKLRGKVEVDSEPGSGSVFSINLPLTLAIIDGMVIGVGEERYILPLTSIVSSLRPLPEQVSTLLDKGEMIRVQDELFPLVRLHERFGVRALQEDPCKALVVLIEAEGERCCLLVDELLGLQQVVIKGLSEQLRQDPCLSGCAILGDGKVGLILDANGLVARTRKRSRMSIEDAYQRAS